MGGGVGWTGKLIFEGFQSVIGSTVLKVGLFLLLGINPNTPYRAPLSLVSNDIHCHLTFFKWNNYSGSNVPALPAPQPAVFLCYNWSLHAAGNHPALLTTKNRAEQLISASAPLLQAPRDLTSCAGTAGSRSPRSLFCRSPQHEGRHAAHGFPAHRNSRNGMWKHKWKDTRSVPHPSVAKGWGQAQDGQTATAPDARGHLQLPEKHHLKL